LADLGSGGFLEPPSPTLTLLSPLIELCWRASGGHDHYLS
jgi:hypothetical protein